LKVAEGGGEGCVLVAEGGELGSCCGELGCERLELGGQVRTAVLQSLILGLQMLNYLLIFLLFLFIFLDQSHTFFDLFPFFPSLPFFHQLLNFFLLDLA
jgi:hypothetical protein